VVARWRVEASKGECPDSIDTLYSLLFDTVNWLSVRLSHSSSDRRRYHATVVYHSSRLSIALPCTAMDLCIGVNTEVHGTANAVCDFYTVLIDEHYCHFSHTSDTVHTSAESLELGFNACCFSHTLSQCYTAPAYAESKPTIFTLFPARMKMTYCAYYLLPS